MTPTPPTATEERRKASAWGDNPWAAFAIRAVAFAAPLVLAFIATWLLTLRWPAPDRWLPAAGRFFVLAGVAMTLGAATDRVARRFLPLAALLRLSLVFPDQAPSRFIIALRSGSTRSLEKRLAQLESAEFTGSEAEAAQVIVELTAALSRHDRLTRGHSERVRAYTALIAEEIGLNEQDSNRLQWAGLIHDVGKLKIPYEILSKPGALTDREFTIVKTHPTQGMHLVAPLADFLGPWIGAVGEHHERFDGEGYPRGLRGDDISVAGRIVAVADAYDVMTAARSYKKPISAASAREELARCAGTQFDPDVVRAFLNVGVGKVRRSMWPLSWALQVPFLGSAVAAPVSQAVTASVLTLATATGITVATGGFEPIDIPEAIAYVQAAATELRLTDEIGPSETLTTRVSTPSTSTAFPTTTNGTVATTSISETTPTSPSGDAARSTSSTITTTTIQVTTTTVDVTLPPASTSTTEVLLPSVTTEVTTTDVVPIDDCERAQAGATELEGADLNGCNLGSVDLTGAVLDGATLEGAVLDGTTLKEASLVGARLDGVTFTNVSLLGADLTGASFRGAAIAGSSFTSAQLIGTNFTNAMLENGTMENVSARESTFSGAVFTEWSLIGADVWGADFAEAMFVGSRLKYAIADNAVFRNARIGGLWIHGTSFVEADFTGAEGFPEGAGDASFDGTLCPDGEPTWTSCW